MSTSTHGPRLRPPHRPARRPLRSAACSLIAGLGAWLAASAVLAAPITYVRVLQTDASGRPNGPVFYETIALPAPTVPLYVAAGPAPAGGAPFTAPFINAGPGQASLSLDLDVGLHTFTLVGNQGPRSMTHAALTLAFGDAPQAARIGVFAPFWTDQASAPAFAVNPLVGGSLAYDDGQHRYELTDFFFASGSRFPGLDRVNDFGVGADGWRDAIGQFTLRVTPLQQPAPVPTPGTLPLLLAAGLAACVLGRRQSRQAPR